MNIKRAFIAFLAVLTFPTLAMGGIQLPVEPAEGTAVLIIQKVFTDGNNETPVTLNLQCTNGQPNQSSVTVNPDDPFQPAGIFGQVEVAFVIDNIAIVDDEGARCTVTEVPVTGYETNYICGYGADSVPAPHCLPDAMGPDANEIACEWSDIRAAGGDQRVGDVNRCLITNDVLPVEVEVTKEWDIGSTGGDYSEVSREVDITLRCNSVIVGWEENRGRFFAKTETILEGDYVDDKATVDFLVYPKFDRDQSPRHDVYAFCWATEDIQDSAVEVENGCGESPSEATMRVDIGSSPACTITNTVFFEGIPTLSQYGMAIMALLMLGVGFIGFRRFI